MLLISLLLFSLFLNILVPSIFNPALFLGILAVYILSRQYWLVFLSLVIIIFSLQAFSLTNWWEITLYYSIWSLGVYFASTFLDKSWAVQSIIAGIWLFIIKFILSSFSIDYLDLGIYVIFNTIGIAIVLYSAEKLKLYEQLT